MQLRGGHVKYVRGLKHWKKWKPRHTKTTWSERLRFNFFYRISGLNLNEPLIFQRIYSPWSSNSSSSSSSTWDSSNLDQIYSNCLQIQWISNFKDKNHRMRWLRKRLVRNNYYPRSKTWSLKHSKQWKKTWSYKRKTDVQEGKKLSIHRSLKHSKQWKRTWSYKRKSDVQGGGNWVFAGCAKRTTSKQGKMVSKIQIEGTLPLTHFGGQKPHLGRYDVLIFLV